MTRPRPTSDREAVLAAVAAGEPLSSTGVPEATVRSWKHRSPSFRLAYEQAEATAAGADASTPLDREEWEELLARQCRKGSTAALRLWLQVHGTAFLHSARVDELARLRELRESLAEGRS
jgi:hypothetical protein